MYKIYLVTYWIWIPINSSLDVYNCINIEGEPKYTATSLTEVEYILNTAIINNVYKKVNKDHTKCVFCYVLDNDNNIIATLDFDKKIKFINKEEMINV